MPTIYDKYPNATATKFNVDVVVSGLNPTDIETVFAYDFDYLAASALPSLAMYVDEFTGQKTGVKQCITEFLQNNLPELTDLMVNNGMYELGSLAVYISYRQQWGIDKINQYLKTIIPVHERLFKYCPIRLDDIVMTFMLHEKNTNIPIDFVYVYVACYLNSLMRINMKFLQIPSVEEVQKDPQKAMLEDARLKHYYAQFGGNIDGFCQFIVYYSLLCDKELIKQLTDEKGMDEIYDVYTLANRVIAKYNIDSNTLAEFVNVCMQYLGNDTWIITRLPLVITKPNSDTFRKFVGLLVTYMPKYTISQEKIVLDRLYEFADKLSNYNEQDIPYLFVLTQIVSPDLNIGTVDTWLKKTKKAQDIQSLYYWFFKTTYILSHMTVAQPVQLEDYIKLILQVDFETGWVYALAGCSYDEFVQCMKGVHDTPIPAVARYYMKKFDFTIYDAYGCYAGYHIKNV